MNSWLLLPYRTRLAARSTASSVVPRAVTRRFPTNSSSIGYPSVGNFTYFANKKARGSIKSPATGAAANDAGEVTRAGTGMTSGAEPEVAAGSGGLSGLKIGRCDDKDAAFVRAMRNKATAAT